MERLRIRIWRSRRLRGKPKMSAWTQKMTMHLNGGREFSTLAYDVFVDGQPTNIVHVIQTNGSPKYLKTSDVLRCGQEEFDILATHGVGMKEWLEAHR